MGSFQLFSSHSEFLPKEYFIEQFILSYFISNINIEIEGK